VIHLKIVMVDSANEVEIPVVNNSDDEEPHPPPPQEDQDGQTSRPPSRGASRPRLRWLPISVVTVLDETGESKVSHPFLRTANNWMDQMLIRQLMVDQPFAAPFGKSGQAWKTCAEYVSQAQDPEGNLVFGSQGVSDKQAIKRRFDDLMAFVKANDASIPFQSGCDDQPGPNNLVSALEDLYEIYTSVLSETKMTSAANAAKKADDASRAEALRNASLGCLRRKDMDFIKSYQTKKGNKNRSCSPPSSSSSNRSDSGSSKKLKVEHHSRFEDSTAAAARLQKRQEIMEMKEARKREMQEHRIKHQDREFRFKTERAEKEDERNERADRIQEMQLRLQSEMLRFFGSIKKKNDTEEEE
jgi:hypothetical protein